MAISLLKPSLGLLFVLSTITGAASQNAQESRVTVESEGWELTGDLLIPESNEPVPAVLLLNAAAGNRLPYGQLARELARRGIASLRVDLRGHGESINLGKFIPGETDSEGRELIIWKAEADVIALHKYLQNQQSINPEKIGMVGASYSGEEMAEAGRKSGYAQAYVALSPGSLSAQSIEAMDKSHVPWLFVASNEEPYLQEISKAVQTNTRTVEILYIPGKKHGTDLLEVRPDLAERIAVWLSITLAF